MKSVIFFLLSYLSLSANLAAIDKITKACERRAQLKKSGEKIHDICVCVATNLERNVDAESLPLLERRYNNTLTEKDKSDEFINLLWEMDHEIAESCSKNPKYKLIKKK